MNWLLLLLIVLSLGALAGVGWLHFEGKTAEEGGSEAKLFQRDAVGKIE